MFIKNTINAEKKASLQPLLVPYKIDQYCLGSNQLANSTIAKPKIFSTQGSHDISI